MSVHTAASAAGEYRGDADHGFADVSSTLRFRQDDEELSLCIGISSRDMSDSVAFREEDIDGYARGVGIICCHHGPSDNLRTR